MKWFVKSKPEFEWLVEIPRSFFADPFNLRTVNEYVTEKLMWPAVGSFYDPYKPYLSLGRIDTAETLLDDVMNILEVEREPHDHEVKDEVFVRLVSYTETFYMLAHACYLCTPEGLEKLSIKYLLGTYGKCPRHLCKQNNLLPIGMSPKPDHQRVKVYCCVCFEVFHPDWRLPAAANLDGVAFSFEAGTSLPVMLFKMYPNLNPAYGRVTFVPRIHGFKIFGQPGSKYEYLYDEQGFCTNQEEIDKYLEKPKPPEKPKKKINYKKIYGAAEVEFEKQYGHMLLMQMNAVGVNTGALQHFQVQQKCLPELQ